MDEIKVIAVQLQQLQKQAYIIYEPLVTNLIVQQVKGNKQIEHLLDGILDFCGDSQMLLHIKNCADIIGILTHKQRLIILTSIKRCRIVNRFNSTKLLFFRHCKLPPTIEIQ